jgi:hypothetical protein
MAEPKEQNRYEYAWIEWGVEHNPELALRDILERAENARPKPGRRPHAKWAILDTITIRAMAKEIRRLRAELAQHKAA